MPSSALGLFLLVDSVTECTANDSSSPVNALEYTEYPLQVGPFTDSLLNDSRVQSMPWSILRPLRMLVQLLTVWLMTLRVQFMSSSILGLFACWSSY